MYNEVIIKLFDNLYTMKKIKVFNLPEEVDQANDFLAKNPPEQVSTITQGGLFGTKSYIIINYDDQNYPVEYKIEEIRGLILSNTKQLMTNEISMNTSQRDLDKFSDELAELEATEVPQNYDLKKDREEKIKKYKELIASLEQVNAGLKESSARFVTRNEVMEDYIDVLTTKN